MSDLYTKIVFWATIILGVIVLGMYIFIQVVEASRAVGVPTGVI